MLELLPTLGLLLLYLIVPAVAALIVMRFFPLSPLVAKIVFPTGTLGAPLLILALGTTGVASAAFVFFVGMLGVYATTLAFLILAVRPRRQPSGVDPTLVRRSVLYLLSSILWFALIYWSGSSASLEGLHFAVAPVAMGATDPSCFTNPLLICKHLTLVEALHLSAGNLLTVGAAGITPLDEFSRFLALAQMVPVFVAAFLLSRIP
jgi:hypothetical protein